MRYAVAVCLLVGIVSAVMLMLTQRFWLTMLAILVLLIVSILAIFVVDIILRKEL